MSLLYFIRKQVFFCFIFISLFSFLYITEILESFILFIFIIFIIYIFIYLFVSFAISENNKLYSPKSTLMVFDLKFRLTQTSRNVRQEFCIRMRETLKVQLSRT